ncbi:hypothetical protein HII36_41700 [Nonomuraea sp. NN258]|uniref:FtsX-like permease family protein n=1 Tax=Nonomuraea antri TaxID=2730852 RepID=UPI001569E1D0|nr:FtsX-like permease family protein [Nonomuraea antri]NRQ38298.1 hypothetical protein [Nonomuraea antri]
MRIPLLARVHAGAMAVLFVLALSAGLLVAGLPRAMQGSFDQALRQSLTDASAAQVDFEINVQAQTADEDLHERAQFETRDKRWRSLVPETLRPLVVPPGMGNSHMSARTILTPVNGTGGSTYINLGWLSDAEQRVRWVQGRQPGDPRAMEFQGETIPLFEVGVVDSALTAMNLELGQVKILGENRFVAVKLVGAFQPVNPADEYWTHHPNLIRVETLQPPGKLDLERHITSLLPDSGLRVLSGEGRNLFYSWVLPVDPDAANAQRVSELTSAITAFGREVVVQSSQNSSQYRLDTGLPKLLSDFTAALATAQTVMYLVLGGLLLVAIGVIVLAVQLLIDRLDHTLTLARARGAALRQVAVAGTGLTALAVVPAALAGYGLSYLVPGPVLPMVHLAPAVLVVAALAFTAVRLAITHRAPLHERRDDVATARPSAKRITVELLVIVLALAGAYLLRTRGLTTQVAREGQDPFLLLVPIALTLAAALITLRCYPYPLRLIVRLASRRRGAVPFLGLTRAARARAVSVLPVLILLPALAVSVFASVISGGIADTQRLASWQGVGAPIRITSNVTIPDDVIAKIRAMDGVDLVVPAQTGRVQVGFGAERAEAVAVDLGQWRRLLDGAPITLPAEPSAGGALVSRDLRGRGTFEIGWQERVKVTTNGVIDALPGFFTEGRFMVLPFEVNKAPAVNTLLIKGDVPVAALAELVPSAEVASQAQRLAGIQDDPLTDTIRTTLLVVTAALAAYALVAVVVSLVIGAADRARALSFLRTLGLSDRQAQRLTVLEVLPLILVTALVGLALGLGLPAALGPGVDLSAYAGDVPVGDYSPDLITPVVLAAGVAAVAVLGAYAHTAISRRRALGAVLRVGELS